MVRKVCLLSILFFFLSVQLFAFGKAEDAEVKTQNDKWILCITEFDISSLPVNKLLVAELVKRRMVESLSGINYRTRVSPEYAYYEGLAWSKARSTAAKALATKHDERSALLYKGEKNWRYRMDVNKINADIEKLRLALEEIENDVPLINNEPVFELTQGNLNMTFPARPAKGNEYKFCSGQNADGMLEGSIAEFYGRFIITLKLYTVYTRSFVWEDSIIFSHDDLDNAMEEITRKLLIKLSGNESSIITVKAEPEETLVLINRAFVGRGEILDLEFPPGEAIVTASAPGYESLSFEVELPPGEVTNISINLMPLEYSNVEVSGDISGKVYHGALYIGEAPLTLRLPLNSMEYVELEAPRSYQGKVVFKMPETDELNNTLYIRTSYQPPKGRVSKVRRNFYTAWGATWITGIAAWISYHSFTSSNNAILYNYKQTEDYDQKFYDDNYRMYYISMGAVIAVSAAALLDVLFISRYIAISNKGATPMTKLGKEKWDLEKE